jgi:hypothetical protein
MGDAERALGAAEEAMAILLALLNQAATLALIDVFLTSAACEAAALHVLGDHDREIEAVRNSGDAVRRAYAILSTVDVAESVIQEVLLAPLTSRGHAA